MFFIVKLFVRNSYIINICALILKHSVSFIYAVFSGISSSLSSLNVRIFLIFDALLFLVVLFFYLLSLIFYIKRKTTVTKNNEKMSCLAKIVITT